MPSAWVREAQDLGAGEILLNSMDADGTKDGYDLRVIEAVRPVTSRPADRQRRRRRPGRTSRRPCAAGADAVLAASVFHFGQLTIARGEGRAAGGGVHRALTAAATPHTPTAHMANDVPRSAATDSSSPT